MGLTVGIRFLVRATVFYSAQRLDRPVPSRLPIRRVPGTLSPWYIAVVLLTTRLQLAPRSGMVELYLHLPMYLRGVAIN
jgi:hypothetical protein